VWLRGVGGSRLARGGEERFKPSVLWPPCPWREPRLEGDQGGWPTPARSRGCIERVAVTARTHTRSCFGHRRVQETVVDERSADPGLRGHSGVLAQSGLVEHLHGANESVGTQ
jgi:hypothetical protein